MTKVAVRQKHWDSLDVYHTLDDNGVVDCHLSEQDVTLRNVDREALPDGIEQCQHCAGRGYAKGTEKQDTWARDLRAADDPEEVLAGNE